MVRRVFKLLHPQEYWGMFPCRRMRVVGKVFKPNRLKVLALNKALNEYFRLVEWYLGFNSRLKSFLHGECYEKAKELFKLNTALIRTARDKAVEILKSFEENRGEESVLRLKKISMRFDRRCYRFPKATNVLTPYWLTLSLNRGVSLPIVFGEGRRIEEAFNGEWEFTAVDVVKRELYAHFLLKRAVGVQDEPETLMAIDRGEYNLAVAVAISKSNADKPMKGQWSGRGIKRIKGLYSHIRRRLQEKKILRRLRVKEGSKVNQQLHMIANQIAAYAKRFPKPVVVMEDLNGIRSKFKRSKKMNRRLHSLPFRRLQTIIEYKALLEGIEVKYLTKKEMGDTSRTCHRCRHVAQIKGREFRCPKCGLIYNRDLNACVNIAHALTRGMRWGSPQTSR
jgi:IS605 OrfB family transposase